MGKQDVRRRATAVATTGVICPTMRAEIGASTALDFDYTMIPFDVYRLRGVMIRFITVTGTAPTVDITGFKFSTTGNGAQTTIDMGDGAEAADQDRQWFCWGPRDGGGYYLDVSATEVSKTFDADLSLSFSNGDVFSTTQNHGAAGLPTANVEVVPRIASSATAASTGALVYEVACVVDNLSNLFVP